MSFIANLVSFVLLLMAIVWVYLDAKRIGDDGGRSPGMVDTAPAKWASGVFLALIIILPIYLIRRIGYKRLLAERKAQAELVVAGAVDTQDVWPPPPTSPTDLT